MRTVHRNRYDHKREMTDDGYNILQNMDNWTYMATMWPPVVQVGAAKLAAAWVDATLVAGLVVPAGTVVQPVTSVPGDGWGIHSTQSAVMVV